MNFMKLAAMLTFDGSRLKTGLKESGADVDKFASDIKSKIAGAFGSSALLYAVKELIDYNSKIKDTATSLDISSTALQEQQYWLTQNGAELGDLVLAYKGLANARAAALAGDGKKMSLFEAMGISPEELQNSSIEALFKKTAEAFRSTDFGGDKIAAAVDIFGKSATHILPALEESLSGSADEAHRLGQVIDEDVNAQLEIMGDRLDQIGGALKVIGSNALLKLIQALDFGGTVLGQGLLGLSQQAFRIAHATLGLLGSIPGVGGFSGLQETLRNWDSIAGDASNDMFESMLDRYDPAKRSEKSKGRGRALFDDAGSVADPKNAARDAERHADKMASVEERIWRLSIERLGVDEKRAALQAKIAKMLAEQEAFYEHSQYHTPTNEAVEKYNESIARRMELENELEGLKDKAPANFTRPGVSALESVGQLGGGRNFVNQNDNKLIEETRRLITVEQESKAVLEQIRDKKGGGIKVS